VGLALRVDFQQSAVPAASFAAPNAVYNTNAPLVFGRFTSVRGGTSAPERRRRISWSAAGAVLSDKRLESTRCYTQDRFDLLAGWLRGALEWRNWHTHGTQSRGLHWSLWVRPPPPAPRYLCN